MSESVHPLVEKTVEIEWGAAGQPRRLGDGAADSLQVVKRYKVSHVEGGLIQLRRDVSEGAYTPGQSQEPIWVPLSRIECIHSVK